MSRFQDHANAVRTVSRPDATASVVSLVEFLRYRLAQARRADCQIELVDRLCHARGHEVMIDSRVVITGHDISCSAAITLGTGHRRRRWVLDINDLATIRLTVMARAGHSPDALVICDQLALTVADANARLDRIHRRQRTALGLPVPALPGTIH